MRKLNILLVMALAVSMLAILVSQVGAVSAQEDQPVGVVVAYIPGQSITIVDQHGIQTEYTISSTVKILPEGHSNTLGIGSFVTIIAPASIDHGKQIAVGIVVHPHVPGGWVIPTISATPLATSTAEGTMTATPISTLPTDTATETATATGTVIATDTATATDTPTAVGTFTDTPTSTATPVSGGTTTISTNHLIDWLASLFRQLLTSR
jgi:hypothetical protein